MKIHSFVIWSQGCSSLLAFLPFFLFFFSLFLFPFTGSLPPSLFPSLFQSQLTSLSSAGALQAKCWDEGGERICTSGGARSYPANITIFRSYLAELHRQLNEGCSRECSEGFFHKALNLSATVSHEKLANPCRLRNLPTQQKCRMSHFNNSPCANKHPASDVWHLWQVALM